MQTAKGTATELPQFPLQRLPCITLQKFYILVMRRSVSPPDGDSVGGQLCSSHIPLPSPPIHSTIQLEITSMSLSLAMWFRSSWQSMEIFLSHRWPMYCGLGKSSDPYPCRHISRLGCRLWFCEGKTYLQVEQKLEQVTAVCRPIFLCGFKSETCCWKLPDRNK